MSIELKINTQRGKRYLVITERYWDKEAKKARTKTYKNLGSLEKLQEQYPKFPEFWALGFLSVGFLNVLVSLFAV